MTNQEFKEEVRRRGWTYPEAAEALGKSVGMIKLYATKNKIPDMVAQLLAGAPQEVKRPKKMKPSLYVEKSQEKAAQEPGEAPDTELLSALSQIATLKNQNQKLLERLNTCCPQAKPGNSMRDIKHSPPKSSL